MAANAKVLANRLTAFECLPPLIMGTFSPPGRHHVFKQNAEHALNRWNEKNHEKNVRRNKLLLHLDMWFSHALGPSYSTSIRSTAVATHSTHWLNLHAARDVRFSMKIAYKLFNYGEKEKMGFDLNAFRLHGIDWASGVFSKGFFDRAWNPGRFKCAVHAFVVRINERRHSVWTHCECFKPQCGQPYIESELDSMCWVFANRRHFNSSKLELHSCWSFTKNVAQHFKYLDQI